MIKTSSPLVDGRTSSGHGYLSNKKVGRPTYVVADEGGYGLSSDLRECITQHDSVILVSIADLHPFKPAHSWH